MQSTDRDKKAINDCATQESNQKGLLVIKAGGQIVHANKFIHDLLGFDHGELDSGNVSDLVSNFQAVPANLRGELNTTLHFRHKTGELISLAANLSNPDEDLLFVKVGKDQNIRHITEAEAGHFWNKSFAFYGQLSCSGHLLEMNEATVLTTGVPKSEIIGRHYTSFPWFTHSSESLQKFEHAIQEVIQGKTIRFDIKICLQPENFIYVDAQLTPDIRDGVVKSITYFGVDITARHEATEALRNSSQRLDLVFNNTADALILLRVLYPDQIFICESANSSYLSLVEKIFKSGGTDFIGKNIEDIWKAAELPAEIIELRKAQFLKALTSFRTVNDEIRYETPQGVFYVESTVVPVMSEGQCTHILCNSRDISERRKNEARLKESEERLRLALEAANQGIYDYNVQTGEVQVSEGYAAILGYNAADFQETLDSWRERLHPDDTARTISHLQDYLQGKTKYYKIEFRLKKKSGDWCWISSIGKIVARDAHGRPLRMLGTHTDISERKETDEALRVKHKTLTEIIEALDHSSLVSITDTGGKILKANKLFCKVAGYSEDELIGTDHRLFNSGSHTSEFWTQLWATITRGEVWRGETKNRAKDNREYWLSTVINPIRNEHGELAYYLSISQDITDRKNYEVLLLESNSRLAKIEQFVDLTTDSITVSNENGVLLYINKTASEKLGIPQHECQQYNITDIEVFFERSIEKWREHVRFLKSQESFITEGYNINQTTGRGFPVEITVRSVEINGESLIIAIIRDITERKKNELALRKSEARLSEAQRIAKLGYWELNLDTRELWWSKEQYEMNGRPEHFIPSQQDFFEQVHPDDRDLVEAAFTDIVSRGGAGSVIYRIIRPDGELRVIHGKANVTKNESGQGFKLSGINQDITDFMRSEQALKESEQTLKRAQRVARIGSWKRDLSHELIEWSDEVYNIFECSLDKVITTEDFNAFVHPEDREYVDSVWSNALLGGPYDIVHRIVVNGKIKWVREQAELTFDEHGKLIFAFGTVQDITDQEILREANHIFNQSQLLTGFGSWRWSMNNKDFFWSDNIFLLHGLDKGKTTPSIPALFKALHPDDRPRFREMFDKGLGDRLKFVVEYRVIREGRIVWLSNNGNVLTDASGKVIEIYGIVRDITAEKFNTDELIKARQQAEEANLIKDEFLSVMSHEIRTPLNSVIGLSNLLLKRSPREDQLEILKTLKGSADNLMHLVNDILDFNKIRAGKVELEIIPFNVSRFLQQLHASFKLSAQDKGLEFNIHTDARIPETLEGDITRLNQILNNLLSNAIKFTQHGFVRLVVDMKKQRGRNYTLEFVIEDSGVGIAPDKLEAIFLPFQQSERDISRKFGGTGLGLSIVKALVDVMGGSIDAQSVSGKGSRFSVELTFLSSADGDSAYPLPYAPVSGQDSNKRLDMPLSVLYVEDVESNRFLIENLLSDHGIQCLSVSSGPAALKFTKIRKFDLILMDLQMPAMDGYETTRRIFSQRSGKNLNTPVLAFTAEPFSETLRKKVREQRITDVITKPFDSDYLLDKIRSCYKGSKEDALFSFGFYEKAFDQDPVRLQKILKSVKSDVQRFERKLGQACAGRDYETLREEIHRIRPILKILSCSSIVLLLDELNLEAGNENLCDEQVQELTKRIQQLRSKLAELRY